MASDPVREWPPGCAASLGLFVLMGFVVGEEAGEAERGPGRGVWCMVVDARTKNRLYSIYYTMRRKVRLLMGRGEPWRRVNDVGDVGPRLGQV